MTWKIRSIQVALPQERRNDETTWQTGIFKNPVNGAIFAGELGLDGDGVGDTVNHGGADKAICCHPSQHYSYWNQYFGWDLAPGAFGENLTLDGLSEIDVCVGDIWQVGETRLQVSQPRVPCWKQSDKLGQVGFEKLTTQTGRSGFYLRVLSEGMLNAGDPIELMERPYPNAGIVRLNRALHEAQNYELQAEFVDLPVLAEVWRGRFAHRLAKAAEKQSEAG